MRKPRIGLLVLYVPFYESIVALRDEKIAFAADVQRRIENQADVLSPGLIDTEDAARAAAMHFSDNDVDAVVVVPAVAVFGAMGWAAIESLDVPICIWNLQPAAAIPEDYDIGELIRNSGGLGVQALANTLARAGRECRVLFSRAGEPPPAELAAFLNVARLAKDLGRARFGRIGNVFPRMTDVRMEAGDWPGAAVVDVAASEFQARYREQTGDLVRQRVADICERHRTFHISDDELDRSARIWLALDRIVSERGLAGGAFNCHGENCLGNPDIGVTGCYAVSAQTSEGRPFSCTGDLPTAIAMWILNELAGSVLYGELDLVDPDANCVLLANGGEGHFAAAEGAVAVTGNENFAGLHGRGAALSFEPFAGPATIASFTPLNSPKGYRLIVAEGEMVRRRLPRLTVFHSAFRFAGIRADTAFRRWCEAGAVHHVAIATGHWMRELRMIAAMKSFDLVSVGEAQYET